MASLAEKRVLLIVNPRAGRTLRRPDVKSILRSFRERGYDATVYSTSAPKEATRIVAKNAGHYDMVVCCGGDGTLNEVMSGLMELPQCVPVGFIPAGTNNVLAKSLRLPGPERSAQAIMDGTPVAYDMGSINERSYFSQIASFGAFDEVSYITPQWLKNRLGNFAYFLYCMKSVWEIRPCRAIVSADGVQIDGTFLFGCVTNATSIGGVIRLNDRDVRYNDGEFEVMLIRSPQNPVDIGNTLYGLSRRKYDEKNICFFHAGRVELKFEREVAWVADGEFAGRHRSVRIDNLRSAVQIIQPA
jgi:diacylglycerol kinase (ATP)